MSARPPVMGPSVYGIALRIALDQNKVGMLSDDDLVMVMTYIARSRYRKVLDQLRDM